MTRRPQRQPGLLRAVRPRPHAVRMLRNAADLGLAPTAATRSTPRCSPTSTEGELLRALAEFPRVVATAAELREPHRVARYLEDTAVDVPPVLRRLPGAAAWATRSRRRSTTARLRAGAPRPGTVFANGLRPARRLRARADVSMARAHEAGWAHADGLVPRARLAARARGRQRAWSRCCGPRRRARPTTAPSRSAASTLRDLVAEHGSPAYVLDEADFRVARPGVPRRVRRRTTSTTPARRSCARRSRAGSPRRGCASTCAPAAS